MPIQQRLSPKQMLKKIKVHFLSVRYAVYNEDRAAINVYIYNEMKTLQLNK